MNYADDIVAVILIRTADIKSCHIMSLMCHDAIHVMEAIDAAHLVNVFIRSQLGIPYQNLSIF